MKKKIEDISNSELYSLHLVLKEEHGKLKKNIVNELKKLEDMEKDYLKITNELNKRSKGAI